VEEFFLRAAARAPGRRFVLGGNGWHDKGMPPNVSYLGHVYTGDHNALNCSALAVLNVHRDSMVRNGWSPATRLFEAAGAAACQITDAWRGIEEFLEPDVEILVARDGNEVAHADAGAHHRRGRVPPRPRASHVRTSREGGGAGAGGRVGGGGPGVCGVLP
jgi:spore maturation protein CgeB